MPQQFGGQPIFILSDESRRQTGRDAQRNNINAAKAVGETVRTTLGPKGMDKMLVDSVGDIVITNDGVTILEEMEIEHPAAKMIVEVAKTQEGEVGDGTTTAAVIGGELLKKAEDLLEQEIHPTIITKGFKVAREKSLEILEGFSRDIDVNNKKTLKKIAMTAMTGKSAERASEHFSELSIEAVNLVKDEEEIDMGNIKFEKKQGGSLDDTELIKGLIIDKEAVHTDMPNKVEESKIALLNTPIEVKETETDAEIQITDPDQLESFLDKESKMLKEMTNKITESGANAVFCQKGIDDMAQHYLAKQGILAVRRVKKSDMKKLSRATEAKIISNIEELSQEDLGYARIVEEKKVAGDKMIFVRDCKRPKAVSILIRGGTEHVVDEAERALEDGIGGVIAALNTGKIVAGGGAAEEELSRKLKEFAQGYSGREQLAIQAFADGLEVIPRTLAENAGLDPIDMLVEIRAAHDEGKKTAGLDVFKGKVVDMWKAGVIEPLKIKTQAIKSASEAAEMILRIDDVVSAGELGGEEGGAPAGPAGPAGGGVPPGAMGGM